MKWDELINKRVQIIKIDGFKKHGILLEIDSDFVKVQFYDGRIEYIAMPAIASINVEVSE